MKTSLVCLIVGAVAGAVAITLLQGQGTSAQVRQGDLNITIDDSPMVISYANAYRLHTNKEEAMIDFGINMPSSKPNAATTDTIFRVSNRIIMNYENVRRLHQSLGEMLTRYDQFRAEQREPARSTK